MNQHDLGLAIVGLGFMGRRYARFVSAIEGIRLAGVHDIDHALARAVVDEHGGAVYPDLDALARSPDVAGVIVCTPEDRHLEPALATLAAGKPLLIEKPIAHSLAAAHAIEAAAARARVPVLVGHLLRFEPRWAGAWRRIAAGEIGNVVSVATRRIGTVGDQSVLRGRTTIPLYYGVHDLDVLRWFAGSEPTTIVARRRGGVVRAAGYDVDDLYVAIVTFANGVLGSAELGWHVPAPAAAAPTAGVLVIGDTGVIQIDQRATGLERWADGGLDPGVDAMFWAETYGIPGGALGLEIRHFAECARGRQEPAITLTDAIEALRLSLAMEASATKGTIIDLTTFGRS
ncbi:MAG: Gfo/Idh/MocA family oxidoreductase [Chloroflexia bacterium]|nr:Gfo/Idh/MocA family oxidoreductase [Chloroflexia bacterium]